MTTENPIHKIEQLKDDLRKTFEQSMDLKVEEILIDLPYLEIDRATENAHEIYEIKIRVSKGEKG